MDLGINGKWARVCAASKGLGKGCAAALVKEGVNVVITARGAEALEATAAELRALNPAVQVRAVAGDITTEAGRAAALVPAPVLWLSLLNATACTVAPVVMVMLAIERIGATLTAQTGMIGPVSTIIMGVVILNEPFNAWIVADTVLVLTGVWLLARTR